MENGRNNIRDILAVKKSTVLMSSITKRPFMGSEREAYLFFDNDIAQRTAQSVPNVYLDDYCYKADYNKTINIFFELGFLSVVIDNNDECVISTDCHNMLVKDAGRNATAAAGVLLTLESSSADYVQYLTDGKYIIPAKIDGAKIAYAAAKNAGGERFFLAFTSPSEYETWSRSSNNAQFEPLSIKASALISVSKTNSIILNLTGCRMIIDDTLKNAMFPARRMPDANILQGQAEA